MRVIFKCIFEFVDGVSINYVGRERIPQHCGPCAKKPGPYASCVLHLDLVSMPTGDGRLLYLEHSFARTVWASAILVDVV